MQRLDSSYTEPPSPLTDGEVDCGGSVTLILLWQFGYEVLSSVPFAHASMLLQFFPLICLFYC
ncbi:hypothetical protein BHE74_00028900 [Ensete ventricosum]|uniref:Uncharacterized protein n=1 Tax=Ensete ventricosum TaxID=4639 RepID=A0A444F871_ENSVE|nr:hypothetical protein B296_00024057 [Ensete ventricosum]RWW18840.1 hypothetical protein GW17_00017149 [Ensete ventricosum]RWW63902.1 hypothetical protein BHE74_00028900 [Ensete ventricosum]RZR91529.1 hypothetical protein BHM03_00019658 [Ensete ventricosum]